MHNQRVEDIAEILANVPAVLLGFLSCMVVVEMMVITCLLTMHKIKATDHKMCNPLIWLMGLCPLAAIGETIIYYITRLQGQ